MEKGVLELLEVATQYPSSRESVKHREDLVSLQNKDLSLHIAAFSAGFVIMFALFAITFLVYKLRANRRKMYQTQAVTTVAMLRYNSVENGLEARHPDECSYETSVALHDLIKEDAADWDCSDEMSPVEELGYGKVSVIPVRQTTL